MENVGIEFLSFFFLVQIVKIVKYDTAVRLSRQTSRKKNPPTTGHVPVAEVKSVLFAPLSGLSTDNTVKIQH